MCQDSISNSVKCHIPLCYLQYISHQPNVNVLYWETWSCHLWNTHFKFFRSTFSDITTTQYLSTTYFLTNLKWPLEQLDSIHKFEEKSHYALIINLYLNTDTSQTQKTIFPKLKNNDDLFANSRKLKCISFLYNHQW